MGLKAKLSRARPLGIVNSTGAAQDLRQAPSETRKSGKNEKNTAAGCYAEEKQPTTAAGFDLLFRVGQATGSESTAAAVKKRSTGEQERPNGSRSSDSDGDRRRREL